MPCRALGASLHTRTGPQLRGSARLPASVPTLLAAVPPRSCPWRRSGASTVAMAQPAKAQLQPLQRTYSVVSTGEELDDTYGDSTAGRPKERRAGVILHPTSLPGAYGTGEIGKECLRFVDWLETAGLTLWQLLPLVPPEEAFWSPYSGMDALCGNELLIALDELVEDGLLQKSELPKQVKVGKADFAAVKATKVPLLRKAAERLLADQQFSGLKTELAAWRKANAWVEESALFYSLATLEPGCVDTPWWEWPALLRKRDTGALWKAKKDYAQEIDLFIARQFLFDRQWAAVKAYANSKGVRLVGDMPIYVGGQSADVWAYQGLFELTASGAPAVVSGVPPDAFSETGQLWGSPLYDWKAHKKDGFKWWVQRLRRNFQLYDDTRIDHFRGFAGYWAVDAKAETAMDGSWKKGPSMELFEALEKELGHVPIIAEDLGVITPDVTALREAIGAPGMVVLQFAWGSDGRNTHLPHNHYENSVCYPGTHDNETAVGWWRDSAGKQDKAFLSRYLGMDNPRDPAGLFMRESMRSVSRSAIILMQDVMRLDNSARMNHPGTTVGNWAWRIGGPDVWGKLKKEAAELRSWAEAYDRLPPQPKKEE